VRIRRGVVKTGMSKKGNKGREGQKRETCPVTRKAASLAKGTFMGGKKNPVSRRGKLR